MANRSSTRKFKVKRRHQKHCVYCRRKLNWTFKDGGRLPRNYPTTDHIVPYSQFAQKNGDLNGRHGINYMNCVIVCGECNAIKADKSVDYFFKYMLDHPKKFPLVHKLMQEA